MRKNLPQRAPGYPYFDTSRDHIGSSPHMSPSLCGTCTACCCSDLYTHTKRRETRFIGLLSWCKQFHFCFGLKYVTFSKKWHDDKVHMICFHCGQSVSIRSRSSIQKEKSARLLFRLTPVCFGFFETLRPLSCFSGRHSSVSSSFSSSLGDISSSMLMVVFSCALAVVKRLDLGYKESTMLCSNNHKLKLLQVNLQEKLTFGGTYSNESSGLFSLLVLGTRIFFSLARCTIESFCRHG